MGLKKVYPIKKQEFDTGCKRIKLVARIKYLFYL